MREKDTIVSVGGNFTGLLAVAFIVLKLCNVISWSWWWVLSPIWIPCGLFVVLLVLWFIVYVIANWVDSGNNYNRW